MKNYLNIPEQIKNKSGFTMIELIIVAAILGIMVMVVAQVYIMGMVHSKTDMVKAELQMESKSAMEGIIKNIKLSSNVETTYLGYTTDATNLVLKIPAIDTSENFIYNPPGSSTRDYDYIIYYLNGKNLHKLVSSTNTDSRLFSQDGEDNIILSNVKSLSFTYPDASLVAIDLTIENTKYKEPVEVNLVANGRLRNVQ